MLRSVGIRSSPAVEIAKLLSLWHVDTSMTLFSKIWEMCFAGFGKVVERLGAGAGPTLSVLIYAVIWCRLVLFVTTCLYFQ